MRATFAARRLACLGAVALFAAACGPNQPAAVDALNKPPGIANLMRERLRGDLTTGRASPAPLTLPARVRILPYDYQTGLKQVDVLKHLDGLADALKKHPELAREASVLPEAYGNSIGASFDGLMKLSASLRADVFLLVSGRSSFVEAKEKGVNPFEWLGRKSYWEAHASLEALWVEAPSGRFLPSLQAAATAGPDLVVADDGSTSSAAYALRRQVESAAFRRLADAMVAQLRAELAAAPSPTPTPTPAQGATEAAPVEDAPASEAP